MNNEIFDAADLPMNDLAEVGLVTEDGVALEEADLKALLSGRRTQMLRLENLEFAGMKIASLDAKLSLVAGADGKPELLVHPTYLRSVAPTYLTEAESWALETGDETSVEKEVVDGDGKRRRVLVEFDPETNEFLETDEDKLQSPDEINGHPLTPEQKAKYQRGKEVKVPDGTKVQYTATNRQGIRANRVALIASIIFDGGISYLLFHGIKALAGRKHDAASTEQSQGYKDTVAEMKKQQEKEPAPKLDLSSGEDGREYKRRTTR